MTGKIYLGWKDVDDLVNKLCQQIKDNSFQYIHGLQRGGLIPAVMMSHKLNIPYTSRPHLYGNKCLIVDDICDSGETLQKWKGYYTAVLHYKSHTSCFHPDIYSERTTSDNWIVYPWEAENSKTIQDYKLDK